MQLKLSSGSVKLLSIADFELSGIYNDAVGARRCVDRLKACATFPHVFIRLRVGLAFLGVVGQAHLLHMLARSG